MVTFRVNSMLNSMCYRIGDCIIDSGDDCVFFEDVKAVLLTHAHLDHIYGLNVLCGTNPEAKVYTNYHERMMLLDAK